MSYTLLKDKCIATDIWLLSINYGSCYHYTGGIIPFSDKNIANV